MNGLNRLTDTILKLKKTIPNYVLSIKSNIDKLEYNIMIRKDQNEFK